MDKTRESTYAAVLAAVVIAVTIMNGSGVFLKRTGLINRPAYDRYLEFHYAGGTYGRGPLPTARYLREKPYRDYLFRPEGAEVLLKLAKDAVVVLLLALSSVWLARRFVAFPHLRNAWPAYLLAGLLVVSFFLTMFRWGITLSFIGLRAFSFLALALSSVWLTKGPFIKALTTAAALLLGLEALAVCFEALRGLPIYGYLLKGVSIPARLTGTFDRPNTLGIFAVLAFAFYLSYGRTRQGWFLLSILTLFLVYVSGSATGVVVLIVLGAGSALNHPSLWRKVFVRVLFFGIVALTIVLLPALTGRPEVLDSLTARTKELQSVFEILNGGDLISGKGLGVGTNTAFQLFRESGPLAAADPGRIGTVSVESLPVMLVYCAGIPGLAAFYLLLLWAALKDPKSVPFLTALFLASLTCKVVEIFPINLFLATALARSFVLVHDRKDDVHNAQTD